MRQREGYKILVLLVSSQIPIHLRKLRVTSEGLWNALRDVGDCTRPVRGCLGEETRWPGEEQAWKKRSASLVYVCGCADTVSLAAGAVGMCQPRLSLRSLAAPYYCLQPPRYNWLVGRSCPKFLLDIRCFRCWVKQEVSYLLPEQRARGKPLALCLKCAFCLFLATTIFQWKELCMLQLAWKKTRL